MKKIYAFLLLLPFFSIAFTQNWNPIPDGYKAHFRIDTASVITHSIWADSKVVINGNDVYYLNQVVGKCDTCRFDSAFCDGVPYPCFYTPKKHQFLQEKMVHRADGSWLFESPGAFVLYPEMPLNQPWIFDTLRNIRATIVSKQWKSVFQRMDSVITISLSTGWQFELSQHYGLLSLPDTIRGQTYLLQGLEGPDPVGEQVVSFWEIYDFEVGDVLQYAAGEWNFGSRIIDDYRDRVRVLAKRVQGDTIEFDVRIFREIIWREPFTSDPFEYHLSETWRYIYSEMHASALYPKQGYFLFSNSDPFEYLQYMHMVAHPYWGIGKGYGSGQWPNNHPLLVKANPHTYIPTTYFNESEYFHPKLGRTGMDRWGFESHYYRHLLGYTRNGVTIGEVDSPINIDQPLDPIAFHLSPNPSSGLISLQWESIPTEAVITIYNQLGQQVYQQQVIGQQVLTLDLSERPKGLYWVRLVVGEKSAVKRFVRD